MSAQIFYNNGSSSSEIITHLVNASDGAGLHFSSGGNVVTTNGAFQLGTADFSVEFILDQTSANTSDNYLFVSHTAGNNRILVKLISSSNKLEIDWRNSSGASQVRIIDYDMTADFGSATHFVLAFDRSANATLYKNGNSVGEISISAELAIDVGSGNANTGRIGTGSTDGFIGSLYRFRTWNKLVSPTSVYESASIDFADQWGSQTDLVNANSAGSGTAWTGAAGGTPPTGWEDSGSSFTIDSLSGSGAEPALKAEATGGFAWVRPAFNFTKGKNYEIRFIYKNTAGDTLKYSVDEGATTISLADSTSWSAEQVITFTGTGGRTWLFSYPVSGDIIWIDTVSIREIGAAFDLDLAYANPTQSDIVQNRSGSGDGTAAGGVTQISPIEQLNSRAIAVGTAQSAPADGQVYINGPTGGDGFVHENANGVKLVTQSNTTTGYLGTKSNHPLKLIVNNDGKVTITSGGLVNISDSTNRALGPAGASNLQISGTGAMQLGMLRSANNAGGPHINLTKSRGAAPGTFAIVQDGDSLGKLSFGADDGADYASLGAYIEAKVAGTPGANDMPGSLVLATTADGATDPTPRLTINSAGVTTVSSTGNPLMLLNRATASGTAAVLLQSNGTSVGQISATTAGVVDIASGVGAALATRLSISAAGLASFSAGIAFSGQTDASGTGITSGASTLNHYEVGTFTPSLGGNTTYTTQTGQYTRIGRLVNIRCNIQVNVLGTGSTYTISGLPFTSAATGNPTASASVGFFASLAVSPVYVSAFVHAGGTIMNMTGITGAFSGANSALPVFGDGARVDLTCSYFV